MRGRQRGDRRRVRGPHLARRGRARRAPRLRIASLGGQTLRRQAAHVRDARERSFGATAEAVQSQLTPETRLVVLTHLHNPTGAALETGDVDALDKLAEKHGFWILVDETLRDADPEQPLGTLARRGSRWVTISSLTKSYGLGGLRIGWIAGGADVLGRCADALNALSVQPASPSLALALALVPHLDDLRSRARRILQINHAAWAEFLSRTVTSKKGPGGIDLDTGLAPRGTTAWCLFGGDTHGDEFSAMCASKFDLAVVPGGFFGDSRGIRIGVGIEPRKFEAALEPLGRALEAFTPARTAA